MTDLTYQPLSPEDAAAWRMLRIEGTRDFPLGFLISEEDAKAASVAHCRDIIARGALRGVYDGGTLVGFCGYRPQTLARTRHRAEIGPFYVTQPYHGSGAASVMMQGVIAEAAANGVSRLELYVDTANPRAIAFYEGLGFVRVATIADGVRIDGQSRDDFLYHLDIAS